MNLFGISLPTSAPKIIPPAPLDAPLRPSHFSPRVAMWFAIPLGAVIWWSLGSAVPWALGQGSPLWPLTIIALLVLCLVVTTPIYQRLRFDRIGWYEHHETFVPDLPYEMKANGERIVLDENGISFSEFLSKKQSINYAEIVNVTLECHGSCLTGIIISRKTKGYHSVNEPPPPQGAFTISDWANGQIIRTAIAILRKNALQATFVGPRWVEEGWVPRLGFSHPDRGGDREW